MWRKVPECVAEKWDRSKGLRKFADKVESFYSLQGDSAWVGAYVGEDERVHGYLSQAEGFQDELYDLVQRVRDEAKRLEGCCS